jgi:hypothetical protein
MLIGEKETFAVECYHDPLPNEARRVFGRMCLWVGGNPLGDISEPACMLNVTEGHLQSLLHRLDALDDPAVGLLSDRDAFEFLDRALYRDDARSAEDIAADAARFFKFDLLTNGGESFDRTKSFIVGDGERLRVLFEDHERGFVSARVGRASFTLTVRGFLAWVSDEGKNAG